MRLGLATGHHWSLLKIGLNYLPEVSIAKQFL